MGDDDFNPYEWHIGDPADWGDGIAGVPDIPYMGYLNDDDDEDDKPPRRSDSRIQKAQILSDEAWELNNQERYEEALVLINHALEIYSGNFNDFNRKAIILENLFRREEALKFYDKALSIKSTEVVRANKAYCILSLLQLKRTLCELSRDDLDLINEALKILPDCEDNYAYLHIKGNILETIGEPVKAKMCYFIASKFYDRVDEAEKQLKLLRESKDTYIIIAGTNYHQSFEPFHEGVIMNLIREPENKYDRDAIRVEIDGKTVGYVANSEMTLIKEVKSATDIKNTKSTKAEFAFILLKSYVIAKLI